MKSLVLTEKRINNSSNIGSQLTGSLKKANALLKLSISDTYSQSVYDLFMFIMFTRFMLALFGHGSRSAHSHQNNESVFFHDN